LNYLLLLYNRLVNQLLAYQQFLNMKSYELFAMKKEITLN